MTLSIDSLWAYLAVNEEGEGIIGELTPNGWLPLVGADKERIASLRPLAERAAAASGRRVVLAKFSVREDIEIIDPDLAEDGGVTLVVDFGAQQEGAKS